MSASPFMRCPIPEPLSRARPPFPSAFRSSGLGADRARELSGGVREPPGEHADEFERSVGVLADDLGEKLLGDPQRLEPGDRFRGGGARHVAEDGDLADDFVAADHVDHDRARGARHADLDLALDHDVSGVAHVARREHDLAGVVGQPLGAEAQKLLHRRLDLREDGKLPDQLDFLFEAHPVFLFSCAKAPLSTRRPRSITSTTPKRSPYSGRDSTQATACSFRSFSTRSSTRSCDAGSSTAAAWSNTRSTGRLSSARTIATFWRSGAAKRAPPTPT